jgi:hypothetical protein
LERREVITLNLANGDGRLDLGAILIHDRIDAVLPALMPRSSRRAHEVLDVSIAVPIAIPDDSSLTPSEHHGLKRLDQMTFD